MITVFVMIFVCCIAVAEGSKNCDRVQFFIDGQNGIKTIQNFTKQSFLKNGQPVYYSISEYAETVIWRTNETWISQTRPSYSGNKITKTKTQTSSKNLIFVFLKKMSK